MCLIQVLLIWRTGNRATTKEREREKKTKSQSSSIEQIVDDDEEKKTALATDVVALIRSAFFYSQLHRCTILGAYLSDNWNHCSTKCSSCFAYIWQSLKGTDWRIIIILPAPISLLCWWTWSLIQVNNQSILLHIFSSRYINR